MCVVVSAYLYSYIHVSHVREYVHLHTQINVYIHIYTCSYAHICICMYLPLPVHVFVYMCTCVLTCARACLYVHGSVYAHICVFLFICLDSSFLWASWPPKLILQDDQLLLSWVPSPWICQPDKNTTEDARAWHHTRWTDSSSEGCSTQSLKDLVCWEHQSHHCHQRIPPLILW